MERDHGINEAQRILAEGLRYRGLAREGRQRLKKGDPRKLTLTVRIRTRITVPSA